MHFFTLSKSFKMTSRPNLVGLKRWLNRHQSRRLEGETTLQQRPLSWENEKYQGTRKSTAQNYYVYE
jgi:hypothetical protein